MSENTKECTRKTVYISEELVKKSEILFGSAGVDSFSAFAVKAIENYINAIVMENTSRIITKEMKKAIRDEVAPIASRLSKGLFRYAVELDMLTQTLAYMEAKVDESELEDIRRFANELDLSINVQSKVYPKSDISVFVPYSPRFYGVERSETEEKRGGATAGYVAGYAAGVAVDRFSHSRYFTGGSPNRLTV